MIGNLFDGFGYSLAERVLAVVIVLAALVMLGLFCCAGLVCCGKL